MRLFQNLILLKILEFISLSLVVGVIRRMSLVNIMISFFRIIDRTSQQIAAAQIYIHLNSKYKDKVDLPWRDYKLPVFFCCSSLNYKKIS
jgi:hypothetical protein